VQLDLDDLAGVVADAIASATAPLLARIAVLEEKGSPAAIVGEKGERGADGRDAVVDDVLLEALAVKAAALIPPARFTPEDVRPIIEEAVAATVAKAVEQIPTPQDGAAGPPGESVELAVVERMVATAVAALPPPKDGISVTVEDVAPLVSQEVERAVKSLPAPQNGVGVAGAVIDQRGVLVLTLSDGSLRELGPVVGHDGTDGAQGIDGLMGPAGRDGQDGTLENLKAVFDGERTIALCFKDTGEPIEGGTIKLTGLTIYRGIWSPERGYDIGDQTTYQGGIWTAKAVSRGAQPGTNAGAEFWTLSAKRGDTGKAGPQGKPGLPGARGEKGDPGRHGGF